MSKEQATLPVDMLDSIQQIREVNPGLWIEDHCKIINKNGDLVPLIANEAQLILMRAIQSQIDAGKPIRIIILKARQRGMTTWGAALLYCWCNTKQNRNALISAQDDDAATGIFRRVKLYQTQNPIQIPTLYSTRKEITYDDPHRSSILVKTAGKEQLGRSDTIHYVHLSEVSFYANAKNTLLSVLQCVPKNNPDTSVILESSPNSMGGEFYQRWIAAKAGKSDFIPVFLPWWSEAEYSTPSPPDMSLTDIELELKTAYNLKNDQLQWRRNTIANDCGGDEELFKQEYASNDIECFLTSGRPFFNMTRLASMAKLTKVPHIVGNIRLTEESHSQLPAYRVVVDPDPKGYLEVWDPPQKGAYYAIGADTAEGKKDDDQKNPDSNSAHVIRLDQRKVVAKLSGCYEPDLFGEDLNALGR